MNYQITFALCCFLFLSATSQSLDSTVFKNNSRYFLDFTEKEQLVAVSTSYKNTPYRYAGSSKKGMDCSGLICTSFNAIGIDLPRSSREIAKKGVYIMADDLEEGDLIFFKGRSANAIGHVALVSRIEEGLIYIIHATSSRGVIEQVLQHSDYFSKRWLFNKRITQ